MLTIGAKVKLPHSGKVTCNAQVAKPVIHCLVIFPAPDRVVIARGEEQVLSRVPFNKLDVLGMSWEDGADIELKITSIWVVLHLEHILTLGLVDIDALVPTAGGKELARKVTPVWPGDAFHLMLMVLELLHTIEIKRVVLSLILFPDAGRPIEGGTR